MRKKNKQKRSKQRPRPQSNSDHRCRTHIPAPAISQIEEKLQTLLSPKSLKPLRAVKREGKKKLRERLLGLAVMLAVVVGLVYRQIPGLSEAVRVLESEGLIWVKPLKISKQAFGDIHASACSSLVQTRC